MTTGSFTLGGRVFGCWAMRASVFLFLILAGLLLVIASYNQFVVALLAYRTSPPGQLIQVQGRRMHIHCTGNGAPAVILESALGGSWIDWALVQAELSKLTRVCSYDRAGMGWSEPGPTTRTSQQIAEELDALLTEANVPGPYILVGHSVGGLHMRVFAAHHLERVAGLILVDSSHPKMLTRMPAEVTRQMEEEFRQIGVTKLLMASGIARLMGVCDQVPPGFEAVAPFIRMQTCRVGRMSAIQSEYEVLRLDLQQADQTGPFGALPLLVLSHDPAVRDPEISDELHARTEQTADQLQEELTKLSSNGKRIVVSGAGHYIQKDRPAVVIACARTMVEAIRREQLMLSTNPK